MRKYDSKSVILDTDYFRSDVEKRAVEKIGKGINLRDVIVRSNHRNAAAVLRPHCHQSGCIGLKSVLARSRSRDDEVYLKFRRILQFLVNSDSMRKRRLMRNPKHEIFERILNSCLRLRLIDQVVRYRCIVR